MTSIPQPYDINKDPFILGGKKLLYAMRIQVISAGKVLTDEVHEAACYDLIYLFFKPELVDEDYLRFLAESFQDKPYFYPPVIVKRLSEPYYSVSFLENWQYCNEKPKMRIWGKEESLQKKAEIREYLDKQLEKFFYDNFYF